MTNQHEAICRGRDNLISIHKLALPLPFVFAALLAVALGHCAGAAARAQSGNAPQPPTTGTNAQEDQIKITTEEIRLPVFAYDEYGRFDPTLVPEDILVMEDDVPQQVRSLRHVPSHIVLLLDTGGDSSGLHGLSKSTSLTRAIAQQLVQRIPAGDQVTVIQANERVETIQGWTTDKRSVLTALQWKLIGSKRSRLMEGIVAAAQALAEQPEGSRHIVLVTDGYEAPGARVNRAEAMRQLLAARATVHVISYTEYVRQKPAAAKKSADQGGVGMDRERVRAIAMAGIDPTMPPGQSRGTFGGGGAGAGIRFDPAMRRVRKEYEEKVKRSQESLKKLAEETGGAILLPKSDEEMLKASHEVARDIGAQYIVTYRPKRPLSEATSGEHRRIAVVPRKTSLKLRARQGYVVP